MTATGNPAADIAAVITGRNAIASVFKFTAVEGLAKTPALAPA